MTHHEPRHAAVDEGPQSLSLFGREPALYLGVLNAALALALSLGLELPDEAVGGILAFAAAVLAWLTRGQVIPKRKVVGAAHPDEPYAR